MPMKRKSLIYGVSGVALAFLLTYFVLIPGFDIDEAPVIVQSAYYSALTKTGRIDPAVNSPFMIKTHKATRPRPEDDKNPYNFSYKREDLDVVEKDSRRCRACHGSMKQQSGGKPLYPIHTKMLSVELISFHCTDCHKTVDLGRRDPSGSTIRVDRTQCTRCHEGDKNTEPVSFKQGKGSTGDNLDSRYLISNHGADKASGARWIKRHAKVAIATGLKECRRCHLRGSELDFCGDCHGAAVPGIKAVDK